MIELTNTAQQVVAPGAQVVFNLVKLHTGCGECYQDGTNSVKLRANGGIYEVNFSANVAGGTADTYVQLAITAGGIVIPESVMAATPSAANAPNNVSKTIPVKNVCGDLARIAVVNNGTAPITVGERPVLYVKRVS